MDDPDLRPDQTPTMAAEPAPAAVPDVEAERQARLDYYQKVNPPVKKHRGLKILALMVLILLLAAAGVFAYWHFTTNKPAAQPNPVAQHQAQSQAESAANQQVPTKSYSSSNFGVTINYPEAWTYSDSPKDLSVTSDVMQLTDATGAVASGRVVMNMVPKGTLPPSLGSGATAVLKSVKVDYTEPTASQRASTYLSFAQYQSTTAKGGLDAIYVTGNNGYQKDQNIPASDLANVDPLISVTFEKCADTTCNTGLTPLTIAATDWQDSKLSAPILTLLTSLAFN